MDSEACILSVISQTEKDNTIWFHLYVEPKKQKQKQKNKQNKTHRYREQNGGCQREGGRGMSKMDEGG